MITHYDKPKFKIRFVNDLHEFSNCPLCNNQLIKVYYVFSLTWKHFLIDRVIFCDSCGKDWETHGGSIGAIWLSNLEITK